MVKVAGRGSGASPSGPTSMAKPPEVNTIAGELTQGGVDWQIHACGNAMHAFSNSDKNGYYMGSVHDAKADSRACPAMRDLLKDSLDGE